MFPVSDDNPNVLTPSVTYGLIGIKVLSWLLLQGLGFDPLLPRSVCTFGLVPAEFTGAVPAGSAFAVGPTTSCVVTGEAVWLRLVTYMFLHGSWFHILFNLWFLWIFGNNVEDSMGHFRFAAFYLLCGVLAALAQIAAIGESLSPIVGASGAIG